MSDLNETREPLPDPARREPEPAVSAELADQTVPAVSDVPIGETSTPRSITRAQWSLITLIVACTAGTILYHLLMHNNLGHSALMFLGIPAVLAILLALTPKTKSVTGGIFKGITITLLILAPLAGEGYVCILIASPLFYLVGAFVALIVNASRRGRSATLSCVTLILLPFSLEGTIPELTQNRAQAVASTSIVNAPESEVQTALSHSPNLSAPMPPFLRIGFPRPLTAHGDGLEPGDLRVIHFSGAEGDPPGDLVMRLTQRGPGYLRFDTVSDSTKLTQWIRWQSSEVTWRAVDAQHTSVTWRIAFERQLDPAWYFTPWERAAVRDAAAYLIAANATPAGATGQGNTP